MKESLEYVNRANAAHKQQVLQPPALLHATRVNTVSQMDRDLERAKAGLDLIESQVHSTTNTRFQFTATAWA